MPCVYKSLLLKVTRPTFNGYSVISYQSTRFLTLSSTATSCQHANISYPIIPHYNQSSSALECSCKSKKKQQAAWVRWLNLPDPGHKTDCHRRLAVCIQQHCSRPRPSHCNASGKDFWGPSCSPPYRTPPAGCWGQTGWAMESFHILCRCLQ